MTPPQRPSPSRFISWCASWLVASILTACGEEAAELERPPYPRVPPEDWPANSSAQDRPSLALLSSADVWVAYQVFDGDGEGVELSLLTEWGETVVPVYHGDGHLMGTAAGGDGLGALHVIWSEQRADRWVLNEVVFDPGEEPGSLGPAGSPTALFDEPGQRALHPMIAASDDGRLLLVWMTVSDRGSSISARAFTPGSGWGAVVAISDDAASNWFPAVCSRDGGRFAVVWDSAVQGDYDILLAELSIDTAGTLVVDARSRVTDSARYEAHASVTAAGERLYVAYEVGPENWGREGSVNKLSEALHDVRKIEVMAVEDGRVAPLAEPFMRGISKSLKRGCERPQVRVDGSGQLVLGFRGMPLPPEFQDPDNRAFEEYVQQRGGGGVGWRVSIWFTYLSIYDGTGWNFRGSHHGGLENSNGRSDAPFALGPLLKGGTAWASVGDQRVRETSGQTDDGQDIFSDNLVWWHPITTEETLVSVGRVAKGEMLGSLPLGEARALPSWRTGEGGAAIPVVRRSLPDGTELRCALGDLHRHTDLSRCSSNWDGPFTDAVRYGFDVGGLQFMAVTDHFEHMNGYDLWRNVGAMQAYNAPGRLVQMLGYERSDASTGHRNVIARDTPPPVLGYRGKYHPDRDDGVADYLEDVWRGFDGHDVLTIPHTPAGMYQSNPIVFDWLTFEPGYDRVVEIFQGYRGASEVVGGPLAVPTENDTRFVRSALDGGLHFGFIASSDHQSSFGSFAGAWIPSVTRSDIFDALHSRLTFASTCRMTLWAEWDGVPMGTSAPADPGPTTGVLLDVSVYDGQQLLMAELIVNGVVVVEQSLSGSSATVTLQASELIVPETGSSYAYVRVRTVGGELGWTSPTRLSADGSPGPDGPAGERGYDDLTGPELELRRAFTNTWVGPDGPDN